MHRALARGAAAAAAAPRPPPGAAAGGPSAAASFSGRSAAAAASPAGGRRVAVVVGGAAGLAAAAALTAAGLDVTLFEQGRGLGGRVCSRRVDGGGGGDGAAAAELSFDHGAQYLSPKPAPFAALLAELEAAGALARWHGAVGDINASGSGVLDLGSFRPGGKALYVGSPSNSAFGRALAARCGPGRLSAHTAVRAHGLALEPATGRWRLRVRPAAAGDSGGPASEPWPEAFDGVVSALSANSTVRLLGGGDGGDGDAAAAPAIAAAAAGVRSNVCWALMLALRRPSGLPLDGALIAGGGPLAWIARNSSKPGRARPAGDAWVETWVIHASPEWSNARRDARREQVAAELLAAFAHAAPCVREAIEGGGGRPPLALAHRWNNAYPLNPLTAPPPAEPGAPRLVACGDWAAGPRVGDAYASGLAAAESLLAQL